MKHVLFAGSMDWTNTRPVNRVFLDLRPETHIVYGVPSTGPGRIALRTAEASGFRIVSGPWDDGAPEWDDVYWFCHSAKDLRHALDDSLLSAKRLHAYLSRRPEAKVDP